jgi:hypothetical protein
LTRTQSNPHQTTQAQTNVPNPQTGWTWKALISRSSCTPPTGEYSNLPTCRRTIATTPCPPHPTPTARVVRVHVVSEQSDAFRLQHRELQQAKTAATPRRLWPTQSENVAVLVRASPMRASAGERARCETRVGSDLGDLLEEGRGVGVHALAPDSRALHLVGPRSSFTTAWCHTACDAHTHVVMHTPTLLERAPRLISAPRTHAHTASANIA